MTRLYAPLLAALGLGASLAAGPARAQEPYVGQIQLVGENFCPRGYAEAAGQLLAVSQNDALFSLYGTIYGGDGRTTFGLPDLRGRVAITAGQGPGLSSYREGAKGGAERITLTQTQMPNHTHTPALKGSSTAAESNSPAGAVLAGASAYTVLGALNATLKPDTLALQNSGGSQPTNLIQPILALRYCVALVGIYPSRN